MLSGFYTAASGVLNQQRTLNVLTNNISNAKTPGFRAERVVTETFDFELMTRIEKGNTQRIGLDSPIQLVRDVPTIFDTNSLVETGYPMDMAINGEGFFNIQSTISAEEGDGNAPQVEGGSGPILLTRYGSFALDEQGYLILPGVGMVLGQEGPIQVDGSNFVVDGEGKVFNSDGTQAGILQITEPSEDAELAKTSNGLYSVADPNNNAPAVGYQIEQKVLERNNINVNQEYTLAMQAQRAFQACSQALKIMDQMNQKASTSIASL